MRWACGLGIWLILAASAAGAREAVVLAPPKPLAAGAILLAQAGSTLDDAIDGALTGVAGPVAYAARLELIDARLRAAEALLTRNDWAGAAAQVQGGATFAASITVPPRSRADVAALAAALAPIPERLDARAEDAASLLAGARSTLDGLRAPALRVGGDTAINQLHTAEILLQVTAGLYGQALSADGSVADPELLEFARGAMNGADGLYRAAQPELDSRLQGATHVLTDTMDALTRLLAPEREGPLPPPQLLVDGVELFLSYSSYL